MRNHEKLLVDSICNSPASWDYFIDSEVLNQKSVMSKVQVISCKTCDTYHTVFPEHIVHAFSFLDNSSANHSPEIKEYLKGLSTLTTHEQIAELLHMQPWWYEIDALVDSIYEHMSNLNFFLCSDNRSAQKGQKNVLYSSCEKHETFHSCSDVTFCTVFLRHGKVAPFQIKDLSSRFVPVEYRNIVRIFFDSIYYDLYEFALPRAADSINRVKLPNPINKFIKIDDIFREKTEEWVSIKKIVKQPWSLESHKLLANSIGMPLKPNQVNQVSPYAKQTFINELILRESELTEEEMKLWIGCARKVSYPDVPSAERSHLSKIDEKSIYQCHYCTQYHIGKMHDMTENALEHRKAMNTIWRRDAKKSNHYAMQLLNLVSR